MEIERKFLVRGDFMPEVTESVHIVQGYLSTNTNKIVRVRIRGNKGYLTIKGKPKGISRFEWEEKIALEQARQMISLCGNTVIDKTRNLVPAGKHTFEVDVFHGSNEGLVVAEIELGSEDEEFIHPSWLGEEVSYDKRYFNSQLLRHPFKNW